LNFIHRFSGRVIVITANVHVLGYRASLLIDRIAVLILIA
jgi:hypothetical protein